MKKYSLLMGLMCAALSITSCSKDNTETFDKPKGYEFELYAAPQTRTEVDGLDMKWSANDAMNVFHALPGTTNYSANDQFTVSDIEGGVFKGTISDTEFDPNGTYDWYAVYPYEWFMKSPAEPTLDEENKLTGCYYTIGSKTNSTQQQEGINNQVHISGENIPLYGKATGVTGSPKLQMHHITTLFRINVTNIGSADLNVTNITLTSASENLIGTYYFDITGAEPVLTSSGDNYVSKTAALNVTDGVVAPDATGSFYLATRAFTAPEGEQLTLKVTANGETVEKVATLSKETSFAAGKINKLNVDIEGKEAEVPGDQYYTLVELDGAFEDGGKYVLALKDGQTGDYKFINSNSVEFDNYTNTLAVTNNTILNPDAIYTFTATAGNNGGYTLQANGNYIYYPGSRTTVKMDAVSSSEWIPTFLENSGCYRLNDTKTSRYLAHGTSNANALKAYNNSSNQFIDQIATNAALDQCCGAISVFKLGAAPTTDPYIDAANIIEVDATAADTKEATYTVGNTESTAVTVTYDGNIVTEAIAEDGIILYTVSANYAEESREGWIELALADNASVSKRITIKQLGSTLDVPETVSIKNDETSVTFTVNSSAFDWVITASDGIEVSPLTGTAGETTVTVTSDAVNSEPDAVQIGTLSIIRSGDDQANAKQIIVNKLAAGVELVTYTKITSIDELTTGEYIITAYTGSAYIALPNNPEGDGKYAGNEIVVTDNTISETDAVGFVWNITQEGAYFTIDNGSEYLYHAKGGKSGTDLEIGATSLYQWAVSYEKNVYKFAGVNNGSVQQRGMTYRIGSFNVFGGYSLSNFETSEYKGITLFKKN